MAEKKKNLQRNGGYYLSLMVITSIKESRQGKKKKGGPRGKRWTGGSLSFSF